MPATRFSESYVIRIHECDAYGHLNHVHYFNFMQQAAYSACAASGWDRARFAAERMGWVVRSSGIEFRRSADFGTTITVETFVSAVERARCRREYRFTGGSGELLAEAWSEWILLDAATGRPRAITEELLSALGAAGLPACPREALDAEEPPAGAWPVRRRVGWRDLDLDWRVNNAVYVAWTEDCGLDILDACGWPFPRLVERGFGIVARRLRIDYLQPAALGEEIATMTWVRALRGVSAERAYSIRRVTDGVELVRARALWAWVSLDDGRPFRIPEDFIADFKKNFAPGVGGA